jgi:hypothetical protein
VPPRHEPVERGFDPSRAVGEIGLQIEHMGVPLKVLTPRRQGPKGSVEISIDDPRNSVAHQGLAEIE